MDINNAAPLCGKNAIRKLGGIYGAHGYLLYRVSRFEEYDLYAQNRSFLTGSSILTFTDTNGRLMALKPDVTLSIVKNASLMDGGLVKVYYNENVYRAADSASGFKEIPQTGLECIGKLDLYSICEVVALAVKSLAAISPDYILDISHMALLNGFLSDCGVSDALRSELLHRAGEKNAHDACRAAVSAGMSDENAETLKKLITLRAPLTDALKALSELHLGADASAAIKELTDISDALSGMSGADRIYLDLSLQNNLSYYNGVIMKGFIDGIPSAILSGGRYDGLLEKMGLDAGAIGFAVYPELLNAQHTEASDYDADTLIITDGTACVSKVMEYADTLIASGRTVRVDTSVPDGFRAKHIIHASEGGFAEIE